MTVATAIIALVKVTDETETGQQGGPSPSPLICLAILVAGSGQG